MCAHKERKISLFLFLLLVRLGPHPYDLINLNYLLKWSISKYSHIRGYCFNMWIGGVSCSVMSPCNPMDRSPPGFSVHGILQARKLEWVAISFSRGFSQPRNRTRVSCIAGRSHKGIEGKGEYSSVHSNMESLEFNTGLRKFPGWQRDHRSREEPEQGQRMEVSRS